MPVYVYQTVPEDPKEPAKRYEIWQRMTDQALERHPESGERIRRIIIGGVGMPGSISDPSADPPGGPMASSD